MGKRPEKVRRVVLDTNVLVFALLFEGRVAEVVRLWQERKIVPLLSKETFDELRKVLEYPKFSLSDDEREIVITEEILPFFEIVDITEEAKDVCRDHEDDKFISCAMSGKADYVVSGDEDLWSLRRYGGIRFIRTSQFLKMF
jgi:putative PIN family toxin of toxin-antitoxin system